MEHDDLMTRVRELLQQAIAMRYEGGPHAKKREAQAYVDGYMRALTDTRQLAREELLKTVSEERSKLSGPSQVLKDIEQVLL